MKYKTTIQIIAEAEDKKEAIDIVGDYLSGNLASGVEMKCLTEPVYGLTRNVISVIAILLVVAFGALSFMPSKTCQGARQGITGINAIQPPLKTSINSNRNSQFKKEWQDRQARDAISYIKR